MDLEALFWVIVIVVGVIASALQKMAERSKAKRRMNRAERTRGTTVAAGEQIPTARRRGAAPAPAPQQPEAPDIEDVIRRLMGVETEGPQAQEAAEAEGEWQPVPPPIRREIPREYQQPPARQAQPVARRPQAAPPRQMHEPQRVPLREQQRPKQPPPTARPIRQRPARTPAEMIGQPRRRVVEELTPEEIEQRERERRWREEMAQRQKREAAQQARLAQQQKELPRQRARIIQPRRRLFHGSGEVRRAIILSEVLGPPRAMRDLEERA